LPPVRRRQCQAASEYFARQASMARMRG
jgi:hypothetical protein